MGINNQSIEIRKSRKFIEKNTFFTKEG